MREIVHNNEEKVKSLAFLYHKAKLRYDNLMISYIEGSVIHIAPKYIVVLTNNIGYKVFVTTATKLKHPKDAPISLFTHLAVKDDALDLYGFPTLNELEYFELLITLPGIGPKSALGILEVASPEIIKTAIISEDPEHLTKISGIGRKNAEKIVSGLSGKISAIESEIAQARKESKGLDAIDALISLGYTQKDARDALKNMPKDIERTEEKIKYALKFLGK